MQGYHGLRGWLGHDPVWTCILVSALRATVSVTDSGSLHLGKRGEGLNFYPSFSCLHTGVPHENLLTHHKNVRRSRLLLPTQAHQSRTWD